MGSFLYRVWAIGVVWTLSCIVAQTWAQSMQASASAAALHLTAQRADQTAAQQSIPPRWTAVSWEELPGVYEANPREILSAWLLSCTRAQAVWRKACNELSALQNVDPEVLRMWMMARLQPYRVGYPDGGRAQNQSSEGPGLLTGYYEPVLTARRQADALYRYPLYRLPAELERGASSRQWFTRQEIDTPSGPAHKALQGRAIAYLADALEVLILQIQGSGQLHLLREDGSYERIRLAYAGSNNQPYRSVGAWLRDTQGARDLSWPSIKAWARANPNKLNALLWSNPRVIFFKEVALSPKHATQVAQEDGPIGAQGVPLLAGRSIAVDPKSIPYGTPIWLVSSGVILPLKRWVIAQDTGAAIVGDVRADLYVGSGEAAGDVAGRLKQDLQMWALWPKGEN